MTSKNPIFKTLWSRINERGDFPTLQRNISSIVSAMHNEEANTSQLVSVVLSDFTLTQQVIRLANSAMYAAFGGNVTTVTRALSVLGVDAIGHLALGLQLLENFSGLAETREAAGSELHRVLVASEFARKITISKGPKEAEEAVVCTLLRNLARLLVVFYFPEEWVEIQKLSATEGMTISAACEQVLGVSLEELGEEVTRRWSLPPAIAQSIQPKPLDVSTPLGTHVAWLNAVATLSSDVAEQLLERREADSIGEMLTEHAAWLGVEDSLMTDSALDSASYLTQLEQEGISTPTAGGPVPSQGKPADSEARLERSLDEVATVALTTPAGALTPLVLESWMHAMGFERCFGMFLNYATKRYEAKLGFGADIPAKLSRLSFEQGFFPDVFHLALTQIAAIFVEDAASSPIISRLPEWYVREFAKTRSFILLPLQLRNRAIGLFYGDWGQTPCPAVSRQELSKMYKLGEILMQSFERAVPAAPPPAYAQGIGA
ncbi:HDOD domain-containing protein [Cupriavidus sp. USMAHM13]|uniref:HDOD domain-containing protein n=1 Tax=Cupriavidus sp. USMAHM13 TaxID=1389192 RepID=UPI0009F412C1|nr:HDOD domain-containing protein [Cupriavidus sp. USMAHM13]